MSLNEADTRAKPVDPKLFKVIGLSEDAFLRIADIPYTTLTKIETGMIKKPSVFVVAKVAKALDISVDDLLS